MWAIVEVIVEVCQNSFDAPVRLPLNWLCWIGLSGGVARRVPCAPMTDGPAGAPRQTLRLTDDPPETPWTKQGLGLPYGTKSIDIVFDLAVGCGVETPGRYGAQVLSADVKFRPRHP